MERYLNELSDPSKPIVVSRLIDLSNFSSEELRLFKAAWPSVGVERRRKIVGLLAELAEDNVDLDFNVVFKVCLKDSDSVVREKAIDGLWECEERSLIDLLVAMLQGDVSKGVRAAATSALGKFAMLAELGKLIPRDAAKVSEALFSIIDNKAEPEEVRRRAVESISPLSLPRVREVIWEAYNNEIPELRSSAIYAMGKNCDPKWLPILLKELSSGNPEHRFEAAAACGEMGEGRAVPFLLPLIEDDDSQVQIGAIQALGAIGGETARKALQRCLDSPEVTIRETAREALENIEFVENPLDMS
ncbi:MAG: HEAT repeat domain-containing protein [Chloroflexi bacterium]|nr:HEAT repeat domain-containing protein [Chloroflexota bacterium]